MKKKHFDFYNPNFTDKWINLWTRFPENNLGYDKNTS